MLPFFKCLGGKRTLAKSIAELFPRTDRFTLYAEPFLGAAAVYLHLAEDTSFLRKRRILSDVDVDVMALHRAIQHDVRGVYAELEELVRVHNASRDPRSVYFAARDRWNAEVRSPGLQLYLRLAGFNGLWRYSKKGTWNVDWNKKPVISALPFDRYASAAQVLEGAELLCRSAFDFSFGERALVYLDPPYHKTFTGYTRYGFEESDQLELIKRARAWSDAGAHVVYSQAKTPWILEQLQEHWPGSAIFQIEAQRLVACRADARVPAKELIVIGGPSVAVREAITL